MADLPESRKAHDSAAPQLGAAPQNEPIVPLYAVQRTNVPAGPAEVHHPDGRIEHPAIRREPTDVKLLPIVGVLVLLGCTLAVVIGIARWRINDLLGPKPSLHTPLSYSDADLPLPQQPRLDPLEPKDRAPHSYQAFYLQMESHLREHGPTGEPGFVHIPIDEAIRQTAQKLQSQGGPIERSPKSRGLVTSGEANSGRVFLGAAP